MSYRPRFIEGKEVVTAENVKKGMRVVRGPDWQWNNQDGSGEGVIESKNTKEGWWMVDWDKAGCGSFRVNGKYDLCMVESEYELVTEYDEGRKVYPTSESCVCDEVTHGYMSNSLVDGVYVDWYKGSIFYFTNQYSFDGNRICAKVEKEYKAESAAPVKRKSVKKKKKPSNTPFSDQAYGLYDLKGARVIVLDPLGDKDFKVGDKFIVDKVEYNPVGRAFTFSSEDWHSDWISNADSFSVLSLAEKKKKKSFNSDDYIGRWIKILDNEAAPIKEGDVYKIVGAEEVREGTYRLRLDNSLPGWWCNDCSFEFVDAPIAAKATLDFDWNSIVNRKIKMLNTCGELKAGSVYDVTRVGSSYGSACDIYTKQSVGYCIVSHFDLQVLPEEESSLASIFERTDGLRHKYQGKRIEAHYPWWREALVPDSQLDAYKQIISNNNNNNYELSRKTATVERGEDITGIAITGTKSRPKITVGHLADGGIVMGCKG